MIVKGLNGQPLLDVEILKTGDLVGYLKLTDPIFEGREAYSLYFGGKMSEEIFLQTETTILQLIGGISCMSSKTWSYYLKATIAKELTWKMYLKKEVCRSRTQAAEALVREFEAEMRG